MNEKELGRIRISILVAEERALGTIRRIEAYQNHINDRRIKEAMSGRVGWPWARRNRTRAEAIEYLRRSWDGYPDYSGAYWEARARRILELCRLAEVDGSGEIWITDQGIRVLNSFGGND